jgi:transcriptional antiterminator NusG
MKRIQDPDWYVVRCKKGDERLVHENLLKRVTLHRLDERVMELKIPTERITEIRSGQKQIRERVLPLGYLLVKMVLDDATTLCVSKAPGVEELITSREGVERAFNQALGIDQKLKEWPRITVQWHPSRPKGKSRS